MKILSDEEILKVAEPYVDFDYRVLDLDKAIAKAQLEKVRVLLDGIENTFPKENRIYGEYGYSHTEKDGGHIGFNEAIQAIKALLEE